MATEISSELLAAYEATEYSVGEGASAFSLQHLRPGTTLEGKTAESPLFRTAGLLP